MKVTVSIDRIVDTLLAGTALTAVASSAERPPLLCPDHAEAIRVNALHALRALAVRLAGVLSAADFDAPGGPQLTFAASSSDIDPQLVAAMIERIVADRVLHIFYAAESPAVADAYAASATQATASLHRLLLVPPTAVPRIVPHC